MGVEEITRILRDNYPQYMTANNIVSLASTSRNSVLLCLKKMRRREEVQIKVVQGDKPRSGWKNLYRINGGFK